MITITTMKQKREPIRELCTVKHPHILFEEKEFTKINVNKDILETELYTIQLKEIKQPKLFLNILYEQTTNI